MKPPIWRYCLPDSAPKCKPSSQDADGLWRITCLNSHRSILLYNNDQFWNRKLKGNFLESVPVC